MPVDGLIILDHTGRALVQSNFSSTPGYALLHIDAVSDALAKAQNGTIDPVLYVSGPNGPSATCHMQHNGLRLLCPVSGEVDPLFAFALIQTFIDILKDYFGEVSASAIRENFDSVYQLLEEVLDDGYPLTTELSALRDIVLPPSFLKKVISAAGISGLSKSTVGHPFSSPIPWRKAGLRYNNNEIKFDVLEELEAIVNKSGGVVTSTVWGKLVARAHLSGVPDLLMTFINPQVVTDSSFHPCVRLPRWTRDKSLSFVPPDGNFTLMEYRYLPPNANLASQAQVNVPVPIALKTAISLNDGGGSIDLTLSSRGGAMQRATVELFLGSSTTGTNFIASAGASWSYDPRTTILRWEISPVPPSSSHTLRGTFSSSDQHPRIGSALNVTYDMPGHSYSGLKVDQLKVAGEQYKTYKGVRPQASGAIEFRW